MAIQDKFNKANHIYKITTDIDLEEGTLNIPAGCTLDFQGGTITNGVVNLNTTLVLPNACIISKHIAATITGTYAKGQCLFDETLRKPKWYNGTKWVDATGADV